jgi:hypothetical protein
MNVKSVIASFSYIHALSLQYVLFIN